MYHTEDKNIEQRKELYTAETKTYLLLPYRTAGRAVRAWALIRKAAWALLGTPEVFAAS